MEAATGVIVRKAQVDDAQELHRVFVSAIRAIDNAYYDELQKQAWEDVVDPDSWITRLLEYTFIVAVLDAEIVGFASWSGAQLEHIYVSGQHGGGGIGTLLISTVLNHFEKKDIGLVASNNAVGFYAKFGFVEQERLIKCLGGTINVPCIRMVRPVV